MDKLKENISDFKPIEIDKDTKMDYSIYKNLSKLLKRIGRSSQKTAQISELLKDEINENLSKYDVIINNVKERNVKQEKYFKTLEKGLLEYFDIIDNMSESTKDIKEKVYVESIRIALKAMKQINEKIGIQKIPGIGAKIDLTVHYVVNTENTSNESSNNTIKNIIKNGYRIGDRIIRKSKVIGYKYGVNDE